MRTRDITPERYQEILAQLDNQGLICPITRCTLLRPVQTSNGKVYEKSAILRCIREQGLYDPLTRLPITEVLTPCEATLAKMTSLDPEAKQVYLNDLYTPRFNTDELQDYTEEQKSLFSQSSKIKIITQSVNLSSTEYEAHGIPTEYNDNTTGHFLHIAAKHGLNDIIQIAIQKQPESIRTQTHDGNTIAHLAAQHGHKSIINELLAVDDALLFNTINEDLQRPIDMAADSMELDILLILLKERPNDEMKQVCHTPDLDNNLILSQKLITLCTAETDQSLLTEIFNTIHNIDPTILTQLTPTRASHESLALTNDLPDLASHIEKLNNTRRSARKRTRSTFFTPTQENGTRRENKRAKKHQNPGNH